MFVFVFAREIELEPVAGHYLVAAGRGLGECGERIVESISEKEILEFGAYHEGEGVVPSVSEAETNEFIVCGAHGDSC